MLMRHGAPSNVRAGPDLAGGPVPAGTDVRIATAAGNSPEIPAERRDRDELLMAVTNVGPITQSPGLPGGNRAALNITVPTVVKNAPGILVKVSVVVAGSAPGTLNDAATVGGVAAANEFGTIPNTVGPIDRNWPCGTGICISPGTGQTVAVSFT